MENRYRIINNKTISQGNNVTYWMSRDQRIEDNWALIYAQNQAETTKKSLTILFCLDENYPSATRNHFDFMTTGLLECKISSEKLNIPMHVLVGSPSEIVPEYLKASNTSLLVSDFSPLRINRYWKELINDKIDIRHVEVDSRNIVPCFLASNKKEYGAYTIRPKINKNLEFYLTDFPKIKHHRLNNSIKIPESFKTYHFDKFSKVSFSGSKQARNLLEKFIFSKMDNYDKKNDPNSHVVSELSKHLHFGQISSQRIALEVIRSKNPDKGFLEELIIRRELADNFCFYDVNYDSVESFPPWAKKTLNDHLSDERDFIYDFPAFENGLTHDPLWNAAQKQLINTGYMHGYMRMYWAKKILEWTPSPSEAMKIAIHLNDTYSLDGRDPNGYAGIAWSIGGVHDRAWKERPVFGKIRYMNYNGCKRKFDVEKYISEYI
ncbi:deoxyribodipyrimidine photo-lyase [Alkalibacter sp. M17DMB]|nr:deoxyribodipyrimidine photo-lyase [Alkalibacter mobilis]